MSSPLVTIAIPCHNAERWLRACVESALAQTWPNGEVIVVDDGSTDASPQILAEFGRAIQVINTAPLGSNHARNLALEKARGEWIQFLDADDYLEPVKLATQLGHATTGSDAIYGPVITENARDGSRTISTIDTRTDLIAQWISWQMPQTGGVLWRTAALRELGGWADVQPCCQEHELYLRAIQRGLRFTYAPEAHAVYRIWSEDTLCRRDPQLVLRVRSELIQRLQAWLQKEGRWTPAHQRIAGQVYFEMSRMLAKFSLPEAARYHLGYRRRQLIQLHGPAAPLSYRIAYALLGFTGAEHLARLLRRSAPSV